MAHLQGPSFAVPAAQQNPVVANNPPVANNVPVIPNPVVFPGPLLPLNSQPMEMSPKGVIPDAFFTYMNRTEARQWSFLLQAHGRAMMQGKLIYYIPFSLGRRLDAIGCLAIWVSNMNRVGPAGVQVHHNSRNDCYRLGAILDNGDRRAIFGCAKIVPQQGMAPKIPKPRNSWILYRQRHHHVVAAANPGVPNSALSTIIATMWANETNQNKAMFAELAEQERASHEKMFPGWKVRPRKAAEIRRRAQPANPPRGISPEVAHLHPPPVIGSYAMPPSIPVNGRAVHANIPGVYVSPVAAQATNSPTGSNNQLTPGNQQRS